MILRQLLFETDYGIRLCAAKIGKIAFVKCLLNAGADLNTYEAAMKPIELVALNGYSKLNRTLVPPMSPIPGYSNWSVTEIMKKHVP
ncbi:hypothetical protein ACHQM5_014873 [Ranunculus cassubicifolius]